MLSKYFKREEFACKCGNCDFASVDVELLGVLEDVREFFSNPVTINSACRCISHNHKVGGSPKSMHTNGMACDIIVKDIEPRVVQQYLDAKYPDSYGIGNSDKFTHIDVRSVKARWTY